MSGCPERKVTAEVVRTFFDYDPETGVLTWRERDPRWFGSVGDCRRWNTQFARKPAGSINSHGYRSTEIFRRPYKVHRLAWLWMTGSWPEFDIDHVNHDRADNRWANLRSVTQAENNRNMSLDCRNKSGVPGVRWRERDKLWVAQIGIGGRRIRLGSFPDKKSAIAARRTAEIDLGFHPNHGATA